MSHVVPKASFTSAKPSHISGRPSFVSSFFRKSHLFSNISEFSHFFRDGERQIHYIFVITIAAIHDRAKKNAVSKFLSALAQEGMEFELALGGDFSELVFVKVHAPQDTISHCAELYNIDIYNEGHRYIPTKKSLRCRRTFLSRMDMDRFERVGGASNAEIIVMMTNLFYDHEINENFLLNELVEREYIKDAFPLHDGPWQADENVSKIKYNDRQYLARYWANIRCFYKEQPLNLVEKYYGSEIGFYFAWMGFHTKMLFWASIYGIIATSVSVGLLMQEPYRVTETCQGKNVTICPVCSDNPTCRYRPLTLFCAPTRLAFVFDNYLTLIHGVFLTVWVTLYMEFWKRKENLLKTMWNVTPSLAEYKMRTEFAQRTPHRKYSPITGNMEPYVPPSVNIINYTITTFCAICLMLFVATVISLIIALKIFLIYKFRVLKYKRPVLLSTFLASVIQVVFIKVFGKCYRRISLMLVEMENPKTNKSFENRMIYKSFFLACVNNYLPLFYTAFLRGRIHAVPGERSYFHLEKDECAPTSCVTSILIQLVTIILLKPYIGNIIVVFKPILKLCWRKRFKKSRTLPEWEEEYRLKTYDRRALTADYLEMIIQYGLVVFLFSAFPLVPLCAFINNIFEVRSDAIKYLKHHRRPVPRMTSGIGAWRDILQGLSYAAIVSNAFYIGFTSKLIPEVMYWLKHSTMKGFVIDSLSAFNTSDYDSTSHLYGTEVKTCYFRGHRQPPDHPKKYTVNQEYWWQVLWSLAFVLLFEHLAIMFNVITAYMIPTMPKTVKQQLSIDNHLKKALKIRMLDEQFKKKHADKKQKNN